MNILWMLLYCLCVLKNSQVLCQNGTEIEKTFDLLEQGVKKIELTNKTEVILVFGTTGCGKSTFIQWIAGDNSNLIAKETFSDSGEYLIEDTNDKIGSSTVSKTLFPDLVTDSTTGTTIYDFPGFSDTRSSSHDIAASFFMKTVMDHVQKVKMLFLTSYYTVQKGMDRAGFSALLKNIVDMIRNVDKFENSIALAVTKVDNVYIKHKRTLVLKPDSTVIKGVVEFLQKVREVYEDELKNVDVSDERRKFNANVLKIINIFLTQEDGEYTRINLFRRPEEEGLLSESELLLEGKLIVQHMIAEKLRFSQTDPDDFGFTISDNSKLEIDSLVTVINEQITGKVDGLVTDIRTKLESFVEPVRVQIDSDNIEALNLTQSHEFSKQSNLSQTVLSEAVNFFTHVNGIHGIGEKLNKYLTALKVAVPESLEENMSKFSKYFEFFQLFNEIPLKTSSLSWTKSFQSALTYLTESKQFITDKASLMAEEINSRITADVNAAVEDVKANFTAEVNRMTKAVKLLANNSIKLEVDALDAREFHKEFEAAEEILISLVESMQNLSKPDEVVSKAPKNIAVLSDLLTDILVKSTKFKILRIITGFNFGLSTEHWSKSIKTILTYIQTQNVLTLATHAEHIIRSHIDSMMKNIIENVRELIIRKSLTNNVEKARFDINKWFLCYSSIFNSIGPEYTYKKLYDDIASCLLKLKSYDEKMHNILTSMNEKEEQLEFLEALNGEKRDILADSDLKKHISDLVQYLSDELDFNEFVRQLLETLSKYPVQKDVTEYNVPILVESNFKHFLYKIKGLGIEAAAKIRLNLLTTSRIFILNSVIAATLKNRITLECPTEINSTIVLQANFIRFGEFLDLNGNFKKCGWGNIEALEVNALNTIFIDQDLNALDKRLSITIIAPTWEVIGDRKIILDGNNGNTPEREKAVDGIFPGGHGKDGLPGLPGGSAGAFFGVVNSFVNSENLKISASGGNGGPGQSGGNGANGMDGKTPENIYKPGECHTYSKIGSKGFLRNPMPKGFRIEEIETNWFSTNNWKVHGTRGTSGGNAGSCGFGGRGGFAGEVSVLNLNGTSKELKIAMEGEAGVNGIVGQAGVGGKHGDDLMTYFYEEQNSMKIPYNSLSSMPWNCFEFRNIANGKAPNGLAGHNCSTTTQSIKSPLPNRKIKNTARSIRNFIKKNILQSHERFVQPSTMEFYEQLNENSEIRKLRNTFELVEDLKMLENIPRDANLNLLAFYESNLVNIENYASNPNENEKSSDFKKVLAYLYMTSLSHILNLKEKQDYDLIIDIVEHLENIKKNIVILGDLQNESRLISVVTTLKNQFKKEVNAKVKEAQSLIENIITPEIVSASYNFRVQLSVLIAEIDDLQHETNVEVSRLEQEKVRLERTMVMSNIMGGVQVFSQAVSFFGVAGQALSIAIDLGTSVSSMLSQDTTPRMSAVITDGEVNTGNRFRKVQSVGNSIVALINSIKSEKNEITYKIDEMKEVSKKVEDFQERIFDTLIPLIKDMNNFLGTTAQNLESKSGVALDVISWQVQSRLKSTFGEIQEMTREYKCGKSVTTLVEKLGEVMKIMIRAYDRIQDYQEQQRLATYLADLSSASAQKIVISDPKLDNSLRELQISIRSNILLNQYNSVLNAFKQWVFPFADYFLNDTTLTHYNYGTFFDVESLASKASSQIGAIQNLIKTYSSTITRIDQHIHTENFNQSSDFSNSFFVWKNEEHREMITKLLAGKKILAKADIRESSAGKDAIKFNFVEVGFKSDNLSIQAEINKNLLHFGINMTHLGNSNYRYKNQYFTIVSPSQSLHYSFQKDRHGVPLSSNNVYKKLCSGDILLSPYAMWELKITLGAKTNSFASLSKFSNQVDLVLEGSGTYLSGGTQFDVASYYKVDDSI